MKQAVLLAAVPLLLLTACVEDDPALSTDEHAVWVVAGGSWWFGDGWSGDLDPDDVTDTRSCDGYTSTAHHAYFLAGFTAYRERAGNLDNFVARLDGTCIEYGGDQADHLFDQTGSNPITQMIYSAGYRPGASTITVDSAHVPIGIRLGTNGSEAYVKDLAILMGTPSTYQSGHRYINGYGSPAATAWAFGISTSHTDDVMCPDQMLVGKVNVDHHPSTGKINRVSIYCREVLDN